VAQGELLPAFDAACQAHLLEERDERRNGQDAQGITSRDAQYQFAHDLIHEVVLRDLGAARRIRLHAAVASALEALLDRMPESRRKRQRLTAELARHFIKATELARALPYILQAGDDAAGVCAHAEAEQHYRTAVQLAGEVGDRVREAEALEKLGW